MTPALLLTLAMSIGQPTPDPGVEERERRIAVEAIRKLGGHVYFDTAPNQDLVRVVHFPIRATDEDLALLASIPEVKGVTVVTGKVTDAGLSHLSRLTQLVSLDLSD